MRPLFPVLIIFIISIIDLAACDDDRHDPKYRNCSHRFECGGIRDVGYPFWGDGRADYCGGHVGYQLYCNRDNDQSAGIPEIVINSVRYQVLSMSGSSKSMSIARSDFMDDPCPANYNNSTLDTSVFEYSAANNTVNLTLFYECEPSTSGPSYVKQFTCSTSSSLTTNYFDIREERIISTCRHKNMIAQVSKAGFDRLRSVPSILGQVLKDGFDVEYVVDVSKCKACVDSGGQCGFDSASQRPTCFCFNGTSSGPTCLTRPPTNKGTFSN
ncbi:hypothetical protein Sjap_024946 [Stephania japonica]|uniref:Uncharacterized protein n=1 Tax=Stephania japonica TaxID=461633 RepID=A0AAP0HM00_9MAGN